METSNREATVGRRITGRRYDVTPIGIGKLFNYYITIPFAELNNCYFAAYVHNIRKLQFLNLEPGSLPRGIEEQRAL